MTRERQDFAINTAIGTLVFFVVAIIVFWLVVAFVVGTVHLFTWIGGIG